MKIFKKVKSGFTLVELVIAIAVIAVLSLVSIVTYKLIIQSANDSNDDAFATQLNYALKIAEQGGDSIDTPHDAIISMQSEGYTTEKLRSFEKKEVLWDSQEHEFILNEEDNELESPSRYFKIYDEMPSLEDQKYSIYLTGNSQPLFNVTVKVGFDPGDNIPTGTLTYENDGDPQEVTIRTNSNTLDVVINAPNDKVHHYGECHNMTVNAVSDSSFFEYGRAQYATIAKGRFVVLRETSLGSLKVTDSAAIVAKTADAGHITLSKDESVQSFNIQRVNENGAVLTESSVTITSNSLEIRGTMSEKAAEDILEEFHQEVKVLTLSVRVGVDNPEDTSNYYYTLKEAFDAHVADTTAQTFYILNDMIVDEPIVLTGKATKTHVINLQGHKIEGLSCAPLDVEITNYYLTISNGTLRGPETALIFNNTTSARYVTLSKVDTYGAIINNSPATTYVRINGGIHRNFSSTGKMVLCLDANATYFDADISSMMNTKRCKLTEEDGLYKLTRQTQVTTNKYVYSANDSFTYYESIAEAIQYDDFPSLSLRILLDNYTETVESDTTKTITLATAKKSKPSSSTKIHHLNLSLSTGGSISLSYGFYNISYINCKTLTISTNAEVDLNSGTITALTLNKAGGILNVYDVTCSGKTTVTSTVATTLNIYGGTFNGNFTKSGSGTAFAVSVMGGAYKNSTVCNTFKKYLAEGYQVTTSGTKRIVVPIES